MGGSLEVIFICAGDIKWMSSAEEKNSFMKN